MITIISQYFPFCIILKFVLITDENELDVIKLDYKNSKENKAFEDEEQHHVDGSDYNRAPRKEEEATNDEVPEAAMYEGGNGKEGVGTGTQPNGDVDENIDQMLEDLRGGKRYWRVSW